MHTSFKTAASFLIAASLAACGGGGPESPPQTARSAAMLRIGGAAVAAAADYAPLVQQLYISYFGRPADSGALVNFEAQLQLLNAPPGIVDTTIGYANNPNIHALIDSFSNSAESNALYSGGNEAFVIAIFQNVLGRQPAIAGKTFWTNALNDSLLSRSNAALAIMASALQNTTPQGLLDARLINNRVAVALAFTAGLNTDARVNAYKGKAASATVRAMLATVDANTDPAAFGPTIDATINALLVAATPPPSFATVSAIISQRCANCHSGSFAQAGVQLTGSANIHAQAQNIYDAVVVTRAMPFGNATGMTDAERDTIKAWFLAGAN